MQYDIHILYLCLVWEWFCFRRQLLHLLLWFSPKWLKSGHATKPLFQLEGSSARHIGVFDVSSMAAPLQEEISANTPNFSWHGFGLPEYCLGVKPHTITREKKKLEHTWAIKWTHLHNFVENVHVHRHPTPTERVWVFQEDVCPAWQLSGPLWFQRLDTLPNAPIISSGGGLWRGLALPRGGWFESAATRQALNWGDRFRPPAGILLPYQGPPEGCTLGALR